MNTICIKQIPLRMQGYNNFMEWNNASETHIIAVKGTKTLSGGEVYEYGDEKWCNTDNLSPQEYYNMLVNMKGKDELRYELEGKTIGCFCDHLMLPTPSLDQCTCHVQAIEHFVKDIPTLPEPDYGEVLVYEEDLKWVVLTKVRETEKMVMFKIKDREDNMSDTSDTDQNSITTYLDTLDRYFMQGDMYFREDVNMSSFVEAFTKIKAYLDQDTTDGSMTDESTTDESIIDESAVDESKTTNTSDSTTEDASEDYEEFRMSKKVLQRGYGSGRWKYVIPGNHVQYTPHL